jgi:hypothetical protein
MNNYFIYQHYTTNSDYPFYIGKGKSNINGNYRAYSKRNRNSYWINVVNKYGYTVKVTHENLCSDEAISIEKYLIDFYGRKDLSSGCLVNMTDGGEGSVNYKHSVESKKNISIKLKGKLMGEKNPMYGNKWTEERKKIQSIISTKNNLGRKLSDETKNKISESLKKRYEDKSFYENFLKKCNSPEKCLKISQKLKGRVFTEDWKKKISEAKKQKVNAV